MGLLWLANSSAILAAPPESRFSERARAAVGDNPHEMVNLIVTYRDRPGQADRDHVNRSGGSVRHQFGLIPGHAISIPAHAAKGLARNPNVEHVSLDEPVSGAAYMIADGGYEQGVRPSINAVPEPDTCCRNSPAPPKNAAPALNRLSSQPDCAITSTKRYPCSGPWFW